MPDPSARTGLVPADPESSPADASGRDGKGNHDNGARAAALIVGVFVGTFIGMGVGNAARKRMDRYSPCY
jgi:hypothetical protein